MHAETTHEHKTDSENLSVKVQTAVNNRSMTESELGCIKAEDFFAIQVPTYELCKEDRVPCSYFASRSLMLLLLIN
jgi:hypothetical protein